MVYDCRMRIHPHQPAYRFPLGAIEGTLVFAVTLVHVDGRDFASTYIERVRAGSKAKEAIESAKEMAIESAKASLKADYPNSDVLYQYTVGPLAVMP